MDYLNEIIDRMEKVVEAGCPKDYESCPGHAAGNDCDNQCVFQEALEFLYGYRSYLLQMDDDKREETLNEIS